MSEKNRVKSFALPESLDERMKKAVISESSRRGQIVKEAEFMREAIEEKCARVEKKRAK